MPRVAPRLILLNLEVARRRLNKTQSDVGFDPRVQISPLYLSMFERGAMVPSTEQLQRLAAYFGIAADVLMQPAQIVGTVPPEPDPADAERNAILEDIDAAETTVGRG